MEPPGNLQGLNVSKYDEIGHISGQNAFKLKFSLNRDLWPEFKQITRGTKWTKSAGPMVSRSISRVVHGMEKGVQNSEILETNANYLQNQFVIRITIHPN